MYLTKKTPGSVGDLVFDDKPVDVPDELAGQLLALAPSEFSQADAPKGKRGPKTAPDEPEAPAPAMPQA